MTHASIFSGIGGPEVAAAMLGWDNAFHCEINPFGRRVLEYWFPESKSYGDVTKTNFSEWRGKIDVLTAGFPCLPFSYAGKRGGAEDERYLWPEACRVISQVRPTWFVGENVAGILTMVEGGVRTPLGSETSLFGEGGNLYEQRSPYTIERICQELESLGYSVQPVLIPAGAVGAPHRRNRVFIIAYTANADDSNDKGGARSDEGKSREERLQERDEIRFTGIAGDVRSEGGDLLENSLRGGCLYGQYAEQGDKRDKLDFGSRDSQRICGETGIDAPYTYGRRSGKVQAEIHSGLADGHLPDSTGCQWNAADAFSKRMEAAVQSRCYAAEEWYDEGRPAVSYTDDAWVEGTWWDNFPTVSPVHTRDDGLSQIMDGTALGFTKWRTESIKAYGNAIVPQVMYRIFQAIEQLNTQENGKF